MPRLWVSIQAFLLLLATPGLMAKAQQPPANGAPTPQTSQQTAAPGAGTEPSPLDDVLLKTTDEDALPTDLFSRVSFEYDRAMFNGGADNDRFRIKGQQALGPQHRVAFGYEIPFIDAHRSGGAPSDSGLADIKLILSAVLGDTGKFKNAAAVEFTFPSAANNVVGLGQTIIKTVWNFSAPLGGTTVINGIFGYNKAVATNRGQQGINNIEPEAVLVHKFGGRIAGFLDYDCYRDFNSDQFGQTLKPGLSLALDRNNRWTLSPYAQFALNHFTSSTNLKNDLGVELSVRY